MMYMMGTASAHSSSSSLRSTSPTSAPPKFSHLSCYNAIFPVVPEPTDGPEPTALLKAINTSEIDVACAHKFHDPEYDDDKRSRFSCQILWLHDTKMLANGCGNINTTTHQIKMKTPTPHKNYDALPCENL